MLLQCAWQTTYNWTLGIQKIIFHFHFTCTYNQIHAGVGFMVTMFLDASVDTILAGLWK